MSDTTRLGLPYLAAAQSQKHVTHNDALSMLDALVQIAVVERDRTTPPAAPAEGERYIVGPDPAGAFAGKAGQLAAFDDGAWRFFPPRAGWSAFVASEGRAVIFDGAGWRGLGTALRDVTGLASLGLDAMPDAFNPLALRLNAGYLTARRRGEGGSGHVRLTLNRETAADTATHVYQSAWSARAETGLAGDDSYRIRVSADGGTWRDAMVVDSATGAVRFPAGVADAAGGPLAGLRNHVVNGDFAIAQRGPGPFAFTGSPAWTFDRWLLSASGAASASLSRGTLVDGGPPGAFSAIFAVASAAAGALPQLQTRLEDVTRLAGRTVTLSLLYRTASPAFRMDLMQSFGTGGGAAVTGLGATSLPAATAWTPARVTTTLPATAGNAPGPGSWTGIRLVCSGTAAATIEIAAVQLEEGPVATPFERRPPALELVLCRRFFRRSVTAIPPANLALEMRATPTVGGTGPFDYAAEL
jgi:hypothetical protein